MAFQPAYIGERNDIIDLIPDNVHRLLDVGCSIGTLGKQIKAVRGIPVIAGIEIDKEMAKVAEEVLDKVYCMDIEHGDISFLKEEGFDCIVFADVLEHTRDPWGVLDRFLTILEPGGYVLVSLPNVRHISTLKELFVKGYWPYRERGIHDRNHLRFFTLRNIVELFDGAGLEILSVKRNVRVFERKKRKNIDKTIGFLLHLIFRELMVFQYLVCGRKKML